MSEKAKKLKMPVRGDFDTRQDFWDAQVAVRLINLALKHGVSAADIRAAIGNHWLAVLVEGDGGENE